MCNLLSLPACSILLSLSLLAVSPNYLHWNSFARRTWKRGTLRTILIRAFKICSSEELLQNELKQIEEEFININDYPKWVFDQVNEECKAPRNADYDSNVTANNESIRTKPQINSSR